MSSLFNLPTSDSIPDPSSATDRITLEEVAPRSSSLDGAVTIEFTSSPSRWYSPSDSYLVIGCDVFSTLHTAAAGGEPESFAWQAPPYSATTGVVFAKGAGAAFFIEISGAGILSVNQTSLVTSGSASLVTSGGVSSAITSAIASAITGLSLTQTRQVIGTFSVSQNTDLIGSDSYVTWNTTISNNNGITHNSGVAIPQNSLFNVVESGFYIFNITLDCVGVGSARSFVSADIQVYTGTSLSSRGSLFQNPYSLSSAYCRANDGKTNKCQINGCATIFLEAGRQFEIVGRKIYRSGTSSAQVQLQNTCYMTIERVVYSLT